MKLFLLLIAEKDGPYCWKDKDAQLNLTAATLRTACEELQIPICWHTVWGSGADKKKRTKKD
jgi:hypothetical protein